MTGSVEHDLDAREADDLRKDRQWEAEKALRVERAMEDVADHAKLRLVFADEWLAYPMAELMASLNGAIREQSTVFGKVDMPATREVLRLLTQIERQLVCELTGEE